MRAPFRCPICKRGNAGFMGSEKTLEQLDPEELKTERDKYQAEWHWSESLADIKSL